MNHAPFDKKLSQARDLLRNYNFIQAVPAYEKLSRQYPKNIQIWFEFGGAAGGSGQLDLAEHAWRKAASLSAGDSKLMLQIGHQYHNLRQQQMAQGWFEKAAAADANAINPRIALAMILERTQQFAAAREVILSCLKIDPNDDQARYFAAVLDRRENKLEDGERRLRDLIAAGPLHQYVQYASRYELAKLLDRTNRFDEAMQMLIEAKNLVRRLGDVNGMLKEYDEESDKYRRSTLELPKGVLQGWAKENPQRIREGIPKLAFLGGHPRSGTTLLEQILGSHPDVAAVDESRAFTMTVCQLFNATPHVSAARLNIIRQRYIEVIQREWGGDLDKKVLLDKNPSPTVKLRIWLRVFPELRVLIAIRDPRDVVLSCFFQNIPLNPISANFLSFERTAVHYSKLMDIWLAVKRWEGLAWMETRYESIVEDVEKEGKRVNQFLGLAWSHGQARFHEMKGRKRISSPSYHDAAQPLYKTSVERWRFYEKHLTPVLPVLEIYCRELGYL